MQKVHWYIIIGGHMIINYLLFLGVYTFLEKRDMNRFYSNQYENKNHEVLKGVLISLIITVGSVLIVSLIYGSKLVVLEGMYFPLIDFITLSITHFGVALFEETFFRCALFEFIKKRLGIYPSMLITTFIFTFAHFINYRRFTYSIQLYIIAFLLGILLQYIYVKEDSVLKIIGIHAGWNIFQTMFILETGTFTNSNIYVDFTGTESIFNISCIFFLVTATVISIIVYNEKEKRDAILSK